MSTPVLHVLAGPNGSGKSTFVRSVLRPANQLPFVNADEIATERWPGAELGHAYEASQLAADAREVFFAQRRSFITETVFSHPSKVDLVERGVASGYLVVLHVMLVPVELSVRRVAHRVATGGHAVPEQKIRERYERLWPLIVAARAHADRTVFYDNSLAGSPFRLVASFDHDRLIGVPSWPSWAPAQL